MIVQTLIGVAIGFAWLGVHTVEKWEYAAGLYIVGCKSLVIAMTRKFLSHSFLVVITFQTSYGYFLAA